MLPTLMKRSYAALVISTGLTIMAGLPAYAGQQTSTDQTSPDNTKQNSTADNKKSQGTADKGAGTTSDLKLMKEIRRSVVGDKSLSAYGHNVKIMADHGKVTLKGVVHTDDEKKAIEDHARKIAGDANVTNDITVKGDNK